MRVRRLFEIVAKCPHTGVESQCFSALPQAPLTLDDVTKRIKDEVAGGLPASAGSMTDEVNNHLPPTKT